MSFVSSLTDDSSMTPVRMYGGLSAIFVFLAAVLVTVVQSTDIISSVIDGYYPYADAMFHGIVPYSQDIIYYETGEPVLKGWEYPSAAYLFLFIPRMFGWTPETYQVAFVAMVVVFLVIGLWAMVRLSKRIGYSTSKTVLFYSASMIIMAEMVLDRFDIIPAVLTVVAIMFLVEDRPLSAFSVLSLAMMVKLYPVLLFPVFVLYMADKGDYKGIAKGFAAYVVTALVCLVPIYLMGANPLAFMGYHTERLLEIESLPASVLEFLAIFDMADVTVVFSNGSDNITGPLADALAGVMFPIAAVAEVCLYILYAFKVFRGPKGCCEDRLFIMSFLSVWAFVCISSVLSGQYVIWLIPLVLLSVKGMDAVTAGRVKGLFIVVLFLTQLDFLVNFGMRGVGEPLGVFGILVILVRNILLVTLVFPAFRCIMSGIGKGRSTSV
ncbi:MAG: glycosyltransferase 87 family protein [archaeon]|nr:glycosyltransferase 87 family protein [archaeon]